MLNLEQIGSVPALFAVIMGLMAAAVLAHVLAVAARARRRDLAILRALGFSRGQTVRTIAWQSTIYAVGALVIGIPVGVVLGRARLARRTPRTSGRSRGGDTDRRMLDRRGGHTRRWRSCLSIVPGIRVVRDASGRVAPHRIAPIKGERTCPLPARC